jgi:hypothetical protein
MKNKTIAAMAALTIMFTASCGQSSLNSTSTNDSTEIYSDSVELCVDSLICDSVN